MKSAQNALFCLFFTLTIFAFSEQKATEFGFSEPNYFIYTLKNSDRFPSISAESQSRLKLHISLYYRILALKNERSGLYLGYNQNSFWKESDPRKPFMDNNFNPEISARFALLKWLTKNDNPYIPTIKASVSKESNWEKGTNYRGWNKVSGTLEIGQYGITEYHCSFGLWKPFNISSNNHDIRKYAGNMQIKMGYWHFDNYSIAKWGTSMDMRFGSDNTKINSIAISLFYNPLVGKNLKWIPSLMVQYYYGYAESLLYYKEKTNAIRIGIAFM